MVYNYAKLALLTGFALMADAKKGKFGFRRDSKDKDEEISSEQTDGFKADTSDGQKDSDMLDRLGKRLGKKGKKSKKGSCNEKDFAKGVLEAIAEALPSGGEDEQLISLDELGAMFEAIFGDDFDPEGNKAFERGAKFGEKNLDDQPGCRKECKKTPWAEECESCCQSYSHKVDWHCDSTDPDVPPAKCCTEWRKECYTTDSEDNNNHACKDCYGYGGYGYGRGYGGYRRGRYYGRRRAGLRD